MRSQMRFGEKYSGQIEYNLMFVEVARENQSYPAKFVVKKKILREKTWEEKNMNRCSVFLQSKAPGKPKWRHFSAKEGGPERWHSH